MTLPSLQASTLHVGQGIAEFVHARPAARNPLGTELREDYVRLLDFVERDPGIRVLILRGEGGSFCSGGDLNEMAARLADPDAHPPEATRRRIEAANAWLHRLMALDAVVIAAVDGPAFGGGFSLALHADLVLASPEARFCMSFPRIGAVPDFGAHWLLPRVAGLGAARGLLLTGRSIGPREARRMGIVHALHPAAELAARARDAAQLLCSGPPEVLAASKRLLAHSQTTGYHALGQLEAQAQGLAMASSYHREAAQRFLGKQALAYNWDRDGASLGFHLDD